MDRSEMERVIRDAIARIPERFRAEIVNLAFVIEESGERLARRADPIDEEEDCELLGLYEGVPRSEYAGDPTGMLPDKITLFRDVILEEARETGVAADTIIRHTVWHEIAHYFGFDEDKARELETKWDM